MCLVTRTSYFVDQTTKGREEQYKSFVFNFKVSSDNILMT